MIIRACQCGHQFILLSKVVAPADLEAHSDAVMMWEAATEAHITNCAVMRLFGEMWNKANE